MSTPSKSNDVETPLSVVPGDPHWAYKNKHGQRNHGQGYDYHDPTDLQTADPTGYKSGNAITMYGRVGFRPDQAVVATEHGTIHTLHMTRRYGTQGTFDFFIYFDPDRSTGVPGDFRTGIEHGFNVCRVDLDLSTLNDGVTAEGPGKWRVRFYDGEFHKPLQAIVPFRTTVRDMRPVTLIDDYTYLISEHYTVTAGHTQDKRTIPPGVEKRLGHEAADDWNVDFTIDQVKGVYDEFSMSDEKINDNDYQNYDRYLHNYVERLDTTYQVKSLPLPTSFVDPLVGIPEKEYWKNTYVVHDNIPLSYTVGRSFYAVVIYRVYTRHRNLTSPNASWIHRFGQLLMWDFSGSIASADPPTHVEPQYTQTAETWEYTDFGRGGYGWFVAGSDKTWRNGIDLLYSANGEQFPHSGYQSITYYEFSDVTSNPFNVQSYDSYINRDSGTVIGMPSLKHKQLDSTSYNVLFMDIGTDSSTLPNSLQYVALPGIIPETEIIHPAIPAKDGNSKPVFSMPTYGYDRQTSSQEAIPSPRYAKPFRSYRGNIRNGRGSPYYDETPYRVDAYDGYDPNSPMDSQGMWYGPVTYDPPSWLTHDEANVGKPGMGEDGTSSILYSVSALVHKPEELKRNNELKGYYKCCNEHVDKEIRLVLEKANELDPVGLDEQTTSHMFINKQPAYNVKQHALYDNTVVEHHAMDPVPVMKSFTSWGDEPQDPPVVEQLFVPEGAINTSQVQFLSLSAGTLDGGTKPPNRVPTPSPIKQAKLVITPSTAVQDFVTRNTAKTWTRRFQNTGAGDFPVYLNSVGNGFISSRNEPYKEGLDTTTNTITAEGDKLTDWSWTIIGSNGTSKWRTIDNDPSTFMLSANEYVDVAYSSENTSLADGYAVESKYRAQLPAPAGVVFGEIIFEIEF